MEFQAKIVRLYRGERHGLAVAGVDLIVNETLLLKGTLRRTGSGELYLAFADNMARFLREDVAARALAAVFDAYCVYCVERKLDPTTGVPLDGNAGKEATG